MINGTINGTNTTEALNDENDDDADEMIPAMPEARQGHRPWR